MRHKRGDTFDYVAILPASIPDGEFSAFTPTCQIRDMQDRLIANVETAWVDQVTARSVSLNVEETQSWSLGSAVMDIQFTRPSDDYIISTSTIQFQIIRDVTRP